MKSEVRFPLWLKLALLGTLGAVMPALAVGLGLIDINVSTLKTQSREFRLAIAEDIAGSLDTAFARSHQTMVTVGQILTDDTMEFDQRIDLALAVVEGEPWLDRISIYDASGEYIATIRQGSMPDPAPLNEARRKSAAESAFVLGEPRLDKAGDVRVDMTIALKPRDTVTGYLDASLSLNPIQTRVELVSNARLTSASASPDEEPASLFVVDSSGQVLAHSNPSKRLVAAEFDSLLGQNIETLVQSRIASSGESADKTRLISARPLDGVPWVAVVDIPLSYAYASVQRMRLLVAAVTLIAALLSIGLALLVGRRLTRPLGELVDFAGALAERRFDQRVEVNTSDEINVLATSMNRAATDLQESEARIAHEIEIRADLGRYLPQELVDHVVAREQDMALGGKRQQVTVLFADVVRFTPLCESLQPEDTVSILNELFTILTEIIFRHQGTVDKFLGDCVMAFWGAPTPVEDHAERALDAAEEMLSWLEIGNARWEETYGIKIELAIGINTGDAVIGNIGSDTRMEYTAIGSAVNTAARLEALARPGQILTTEATRLEVGDLFDFAPVSTELLAQGGEGVDVYEVLI